MKRHHPETALHIEVAQKLAVLLRPEVLWTTFPAGGGGRIRGALLKAMGLRAGWSDLQMIWRGIPSNLVVGLIELKSGSSLSQSQKDFRDDAKAIGCLHAVCRSWDEVHGTIHAWGVPSWEASNDNPVGKSAPKWQLITPLKDVA